MGSFTWLVPYSLTSTTPDIIKHDQLTRFMCETLFFKHLSAFNTTTTLEKAIRYSQTTDDQP